MVSNTILAIELQCVQTYAYLSCIYVHIARYGFSGYKGCLGAEFFRCDGFVSSLTVQECETFTLGMTPAEADLFLSLGASLWNLVPQANKDTSFCDDSVTVSSRIVTNLPYIMYYPLHN